MGNQKAPTIEELRRGLVKLTPAVFVDSAALQEAMVKTLRRVEVDSHLHLPDMFVLTFTDPKHDVLGRAGIKLGSRIEIKGGVRAEGGQPNKSLLIGEVTAIEGSYDENTGTTVVRGYTADHRLQRVRRSRAFINASDSDVASQIAKEAGLTQGQIGSTKTQPHLGQRNVTDWAYLTERAREIGFEVGVRDDRFYFRPVGSGSGGAAVPVALRTELISFAPRVSAGNLAAEAEVRSWDPVNAKVVATRKPVAAAAVSVGAGAPNAVLRPFASTAPPPPAAGGSESGPPPGANALVLNGHGLTLAKNNSESVEVAAAALAERASGGFAEARAEIFGDARVVAGASLQVSGVPAQFAGTWMVTSARHVFEPSGTGYRTHVTMSGWAERSLLALTAGPAAPESASGVPGVVCGLITDVNDPEGLGRVKVALPWLSPDYETDWAPVSQLNASAAGGALFLPSAKDQVLVAFEHGDLRRPYVLGSLVNIRTGAGGGLEPGGGKPGSTAIKKGRPATVIRRGLVSPAGSRLVFHDDVPTPGGKASAAQVVLGTSGDKISLTLDQVKGTLAIKCEPGSPPGKLSISCDGNIEIKAGPSGTLNIDGGAALNLKGKAVKIEGTAVQIEGKAAVTVKGKPIMLN